MSWAALHRQSEESALQAEQALKAGNLDSAKQNYAKAAEFEQQALGCIDPTKARTVGITAVSAVSLWYKAAEFVKAEQLAYSSLAKDSIPDFARTELRNLVQAIWTESSKQDAGVTFLPGQVYVSVKGGEVVTGGAPLDLVVDKVQTIQAMFYRTVEFVKDMPLRKRGGPTREIQEMCRPWLFQAAPGSYQFSVAIQETKEPDFFEQSLEPTQVAEHFIKILQATTSEDQHRLEEIVPKPEYRSAFLKLSRNLAPTGKTFGSMELRTATERAPVSLTPETRASLNQTLRGSTTPHLSKAEELKELTGVLRAVDLNKDYLDISVNDKNIRIKGLADTMDDVIGPMVNRNVKIRTVAQAKGGYKFIDIELEE